MKKLLIGLLISFLTISTLSGDEKVEQSYKEALSTFKFSKRAGPFFKTCYGYAIFPTVAKGGFGIGGAHGKGRVYIKGKYVADTTVSQLSFGLQAGGQAFSQIMFFKNANALSTYKTGNFELGAQATAVALTSGIGANADYDKGIAIFTSAKGGLMYEAAVAGQKFTYDPK
jgi:lipid-binding SYLF domain-containing protein